MAAVATPMGRVDILLRFLQLAGLDRPRDIEQFTVELDVSGESTALSTQIADRILSERPELLSLYQQAWEELYQSNPYEESRDARRSQDLATAFTSFMTEWIALENLFSSYSKSSVAPSTSTAPFNLSTSVLRFLRGSDDNQQEIDRFVKLRSLRNEVVHGRRDLDASTLESGARELHLLREQLESLIGAIHVSSTLRSPAEPEETEADSP